MLTPGYPLWISQHILLLSLLPLPSPLWVGGGQVWGESYTFSNKNTDTNILAGLLYQKYISPPRQKFPLGGGGGV